MSDFQQTRKGGRGSKPSSNNGSSVAKAAAPTSKYPAQYQQLLEMGFESTRVRKVLDITLGDLEKATAILLGEESVEEEAEFITKEERKSESKQNKSKAPAAHSPTPASNHNSHNNNHSNHHTTAPVLSIADQHRKMMATYKVYKCKDISNLSHDRKMCTYWHTSSDRRRNPYENPYSCYECPNVVGGADCKVGDKCPHAHNMLERMFHPELFKISVCQRMQDGKKCDRGIICAFAHSDADLRVSPSKLDPSLVNTPPTKPATTDIVIPDSVKENVLALIKEAGSEGVYSLDLYKKYAQRFNEALEISDDRYSAKYKLKEFLEAHGDVALVYNRGNQPVYVSKDAQVKGEESTEKNGDTSSVVKVVGDRLASIIKASGAEGILGSDLPKKYLEVHSERLDATDEHGAKIKMKELLAAHTAIVLRTVKSQPRYFYEEPEEVKPAAPKVPSYAEKAKAAAAASAAKAVAAAAPAPTPTPAEATTPAPAAKKEEVVPVAKKEEPVVAAKKEEHAPVAAKTPAVPSGKSYAAIAAAAKSAKKPVETPAPVVEAVQEAETVPEPEYVQEEPVPVEAPVEEPAKVEAVPEPVVEVAAPVVEAPAPVVEVSSAPSMSDPVFPFTMDKKTVDSFASDLSTTTLPVSSSNDLNDLIFNMKAPTFGTYNVPLTPEREFKRASDSLLPPGLTKAQKSASDMQPKVEDDLARKYMQAQSLISSMQEQINTLQQDLANRKSEADSHATQIKNLQQKLSEAESKPSGNDEQLKAQLKQKEDEVAHASMLNHRYDEEIRRIQQERLTELHHFFSLFQQIEGVLINCKTDMPAEQATPDEIRTILNFIGSLRTYATGAKGQAKYKYDVVQRQVASTVASAYMFEPYSLANGGRYSGYGGVAINPYDQSSYFAQSGILGGADPNRSFMGNYGQNYSVGQQQQQQQQQCSYPGCRAVGQYKCTRCMNASYCSPEHQQSHWATHVNNCSM